MSFYRSILSILYHLSAKLLYNYPVAPDARVLLGLEVWRGSNWTPAPFLAIETLQNNYTSSSSLFICGHGLVASIIAECDCFSLDIAQYESIIQRIDELVTIRWTGAGNWD
jgi:hypothetical protein